MQPAISLCCLLAIASAEPVVDGSLGKISGRIDTIRGVDIEAFLGIPYAKPPVGKLRFALPQAFGSVGTLRANESGASCPQLPISSTIRASEDENCLFLNVYRKNGTSKDDKKAVVAVIHGGGYTAGSSTDVHQSAQPLAGFGDVIIVSLNYRLGIFGFADMKELAPGNVGLHDQRLALQWIQDHIADFGGDPKQVTIMGYSAGSMAVAAQIISIADKNDLFQAAILDAGVVGSHGFLESPESSFVRLKTIAEEVGCTIDSDKILECLRNVSVATLLANSTQRSGSSGIKFFVPTTDGVFLPHNVEEYLAKNTSDLRKVRTIVGYSRDEGTMFANFVDPKFDFKTAKTKDEILNYCEAISASFNFPFNASDEETRRKIGQLYVDENSGDAFKAVSSFIGDGFFKCPANTFIQSYSRHNDKVFAYQFERPFTKTMLFDPEILGVFHISAYLNFAGALLLGGDEVDEADKRFSVEVMNLTSAFSKSDNALVFRGVEWPSHSKSGEIFILNETPTVVKQLPSERNCRELFSGTRE